MGDSYREYLKYGDKGHRNPGGARNSEDGRPSYWSASRINQRTTAAAQKAKWRAIAAAKRKVKDGPRR